MKHVRLTFFYVSVFQNLLGKACLCRVFGRLSRQLKRLPVLLLLPLFVSCSSDGTDPVVVDLPVAYIERPLENEEGEIEADDAAEPQTFRPGAVLYLKQKASVDAQVVDISSAAFSDESFLNDEGELLYDVRDLSSSPDGKKLLFSLRAPEIENADEEDQPTWNIWEYDIEAKLLRRIFDSSLNVRAEEGQDISPSYLPDGRILFTSTRQTRSKAILLDEGLTGYAALDEERNVHAFNLHVMESDGQNIQQLTFNQSHDLDPIVLQNGKILFSRWDNAGQTRNNGVNLYEINPDGSGLNYLYGRHSHDTGENGSQVQFLKPRELENGNIAVSLRPFESDNFASQPLEIDIESYIEADKSVEGTDAVEGLAQTPIIEGLLSSGEQTINGQYSDFIPLYDGTNRYLVSWSLCRVVLVDNDLNTEGDQTGNPESCTEDKLESDEYEAAPPRYGIYVYDASDNTLRLVSLPKDGNRFDQVMLVTTRPEPETLMPFEQGNYGEGMGAIHIRSVYDFDGVDTSTLGISTLANPELTSPSERPQRFLRIEKPVSIPDENTLDFDNSAFGRSRAQSMRQILGYVPIEPDGSVMVSVPANVAFAMSVLNEKGQRTSERHQHWLQVAPGELVECNGCHTGTSEVPHGRSGAGPEAVNQGAGTVGEQFPGTSPAPAEGLDEFGVLMGETMAQAYTENYGIRQLDPDINYVDEWQTPPNEANVIALEYADLNTPRPVTPGCEGEWTADCRITINYESHIHPLWSLDRSRVVGVVDGEDVLEDRTCTSCHTNTDAEGLSMVPEAQLDLSNGPSTEEPNMYKSYRELFFNDNEVELVEGILIDRLVDSDQPVLDEEGEPLLDEFGNVIFVQVTVPVGASLGTAGALSNANTLAVFDQGGSHEGDLSPVEIKLISEWLDLGAQYFNDPFAAPLD